MADTKKFTPENVKDLKTKFEGAGQGHVFTFYDELSEAEKEAFFNTGMPLKPFSMPRIARMSPCGTARPSPDPAVTS